MGAQGTQEPPRKKGLSCGCIALIVAAGLGGLLVVLCCGGLIVAGYYVQKSASEDPKVIAQVTDRIAQIDIPSELQPKASLDMKVPFTGKQMMVWVVYADQKTQSMLVLGSFGGAMSGMNQEELRKGIERSMKEQGVGHQENVRQWKRSEKVIPVRGKPVTFYFATGKDQSGKPRIQVNGTFQGDHGPVMFSFTGDAEKYDEQRITKMIESIK
jgi:hypothetical protein